MRLMGIDPGTQVLGWGVVDLPGRNSVYVDCGAIIAPKKAPIAERLASIGDQLSETIARFAPTHAGVEKAFFGRNANAALRVGEARGVALAELARANVEVTELTATEVKKAVTGTGAARKAQVARMVGALMGLAKPPEPEDAADALAIAICLAHRLAVPGGACDGNGPKR